MPHLVRAYETYKDEGFVILAVNLAFQDSIPDVKAFVEEFQMPFPVLLDEPGEVTDFEARPFEGREAENESHRRILSRRRRVSEPRMRVLRNVVLSLIAIPSGAQLEGRAFDQVLARAVLLLLRSGDRKRSRTGHLCVRQKGRDRPAAGDVLPEACVSLQASDERGIVWPRLVSSACGCGYGGYGWRSGAGGASRNAVRRVMAVSQVFHNASSKLHKRRA